MPTWTPLDLEYRAYGKGSEPFALSRDGFSAGDLGKRALAPDSARQSHFEAELLRIGDAIGGDELPVFVGFCGERRRMDKGCVGHAVARGFIEPPADGPGGIVTSVTLRPGTREASTGD